MNSTMIAIVSVAASIAIYHVLSFSFMPESTMLVHLSTPVALAIAFVVSRTLLRKLGNDRKRMMAVVALQSVVLVPLGAAITLFISDLWG